MQCSAALALVLLHLMFNASYCCTARFAARRPGSFSCQLCDTAAAHDTSYSLLHARMHARTSQSYWKDPEYLLYELNINSVILAPQHGEHLPVHCSTDQYLLQGYAYTGGGRKIRRVEISLDGGVSWQNTTVKYPDGYTPRHGVRWWVMGRWELSVPTWKLLQCSEIAVRAWDSSLNTQVRCML
jgi:nitrate reductase (NAD(P)H)